VSREGSHSKLATPVLPAARDLLWLTLGGFAIAAAFLDPRAWPLAWFGLIPMFRFAPRASSVRSAALGGWISGLATNVPAFIWLVTTINRFGGFPYPVALFFYSALSAYGALQFAIVAAGLRWAGPQASVLLAPALWTASEFLFPNLFPWRLGHSQRELVVLLQVGDLTGPYGLSFAMAWLGNACAQWPIRLARIAWPAAALAAIATYGVFRGAAIERQVAQAPAVRVGIVQGNLTLDEKRHRSEFVTNVQRYRTLTRSFANPLDLVVWPETVVEWGIPHDANALGSRDPFPGFTTPLLFGAVTYRPHGEEAEWFNSALLRSPDGALVGRYDKIILMPFGEFIPFATYFPGLKKLSPNTGDFSAGTDAGVLAASPTTRVGALICYEDLLAPLVRRAVRGGASVLVTMANDAWFGDSAALRQHEMLALWRAIENRRYLIRATNTGLSSVIDPLGRQAKTLPVDEPAIASIEARDLAIPTLYQAVGDAFAYAVLALAAFLLLLSRASRRMLASSQEVADSEKSMTDRSSGMVAFDLLQPG
jgi:apolipoprotein N-acyltransferase